MSFRKSFTSKPISVPQAPKDASAELAAKILDLENQLETFPTSSLVEKLVDCYSEIIELYSQKKDLKYLDFQKRMHSLLSSPKILSVLNGKRDSKSEFRVEPAKKPVKFIENKRINITKEIETKDLAVKNNEKQQMIKIESTPSGQIFLEKINSGDISPVSTCPSIPSPKSHRPQSMSLKGLKFDLQSINFSQRPPKNLKIILDRHTANTKDTANKAIKDFRSQDLALRHRLASRKKQMLTRSMSNISISSVDLSGILEDTEDAKNPSVGCFVIEEHPVEMEQFEMMLEGIMEKNFAERAVKIAETKFKYESQINEMSGMGDLMQMVVDQMRDNLKREVDAIVEEFDKKRKEEIRLLKEKKSFNYL